MLCVNQKLATSTSFTIIIMVGKPYHPGLFSRAKSGEKISFYKSDFPQIEEREETLIYDLENFMAAAGGHLGLSLGFSCLSAILAFLNFLRTKFRA